MYFFIKYLIPLALVSNIYASQDSTNNDTRVEQKGMLELKNAKTVLSVGGRIQLDSRYGWPEGSFFAGSIPLENAGENGQLYMDSRNSRFWIKTRTPSEYGPIRALIELDFLGTAKGTEANTNSHGPRLRHAYVEVNGFTVGQTNSAFNAFVTLDTVSVVINDTFVRQPLIRYTIESRVFAYDFSFEQPETTLLDVNGDIITPQDDLSPDVIARVRYYPSWGEAATAVLGRYITQDKEGNSKKDSAFAYGINMSAKIKIYGLNDIRFDAQYGLGIGRYISYNAYPSGSMDVNGNIELQPSYGAHLGYRHWWNKKLRSTLAFSYSKTESNIDNISSVDLENVNRNAYGTQVNLMWMPVKNSLLGVEYANATRKVESKRAGEMQTIQLLLRYDF